MKQAFRIALLAIGILNCGGPLKNEQNQADAITKPNIIYILADDLGYGDLSCYGQKRFSTPNLDQLASEGMRFTQHYSGSTVCAPSRSTLMTGLHTGHTPIRGNKEAKPEGQTPLPGQSVTIAEVLKQAGYVTGAFGKWGLGAPGSEGDPNFQGFDRFFGYNCQRLAHNYYPFHLWSDQEKVMLTENEGQNKGQYGPDLIHEQALKFLEANKDTTFFMYYPSVIPHAELFAPEADMAQFRGKFLPEKAFDGVDEGETYKLGPYGSQPESHAAFAAMVTILDRQVGEIISKLKDLGLDKNTIVIFTSDNGPHLEGGADPDYFDSNGPLKGYKRDVYEGGIRSPFIAWWPGKIEPGTVSTHISAFWDFFPTACEIVGAATPDNIDGISYLPTLMGAAQPQHEYLYWEFHEKNGRMAIRKGNWKAVKMDFFTDPTKPAELYDLSKDLGEEINIASQNPDILAELEALFLSSREPSTLFPFPVNE